MVSERTGPTETDIRYEIPGTGFLITADRVGDIPHYVGVQVRYVELFTEHSPRIGRFRCDRVHGTGVRPAVSFQARILQTQSHARSDPFTDSHVQSRRKALTAVTVILSFINIDTSGNTDKNVVEQTIGQVGASAGLGFLKSDYLLSKSRRTCDRQRHCNEKSFHNQSVLIVKFFLK